MGYPCFGETCAKLRTYMRGESHPKKPYIDKLLEVTGMTYEKLFALEGEDGK